MNKSPYMPDNYIGWEINNPFAKILCSSRILMATACDGTCGGCKKDRSKFLEEKVQRELEWAIKDPQYWDGADHTAPLDARELEQVIRARLMTNINTMQDQKWGIIDRTNERMRILELRASSPETVATLQ